MLLTLLTLIIPSVNSEQYTTNKLWKPKNKGGKETYYRPEWAKNITIEIDDTNNTQSVEGIIIPLSSTTRYEKKYPYNNCPTGCSRGNSRDCYNNGHIMGLRNGGPDLSENIVAQWGNWQQPGGEWYKLETRIQQIALKEYEWDKKPHPEDLCMNDTHKNCTVKEPNNKVYWKINLIYEDDCKPVRYKGFIKINNKKHYVFEIINNGTYSLNPIEPTPTPKKKKSSLFPWICVFIVLSIWICVYFFYRRNIIQHNQIRSVIENSIELEIH